MLLLAASAFHANSATAEEPAEKSSPADFVPVVLIPPVTNSSTTSHFGGGASPNTDAARERLEDLLVNKNVKVVERSRIEQLLKESEFSNKSSMTDSDKAVKMGKALGANIVVMGTILDVTTDRTTYNDNKIRTEKTTVKVGVRIRVVDITSGTITFSKEFEAHQSYDSSTNGSKSTNDAAAKLIKRAISDAGDNKEFLNAVNGKPKGTAVQTASAKDVEVSFEPTPTNCDILIDGEYRGGSPLKIRLPMGKPAKVTIRKAGYEPWEATLKPSDTVKKISPELSASSGAARPAKE
jgi:curli biogenesis system outer membrane secretion channel CsgG